MLKTALESAAQRSHWKRLGKIKLGLKVKSANTKCAQRHEHTDACYNFFPKDVKYFVIPDQFKAQLGAEPMKLSIMLAFPTLQQNFDIDAAKWRGNGTKFCSTKDGVTAQRLVETEVPGARAGETVKKSDYQTIPCPGGECKFRIAGECPPKGSFDFMIPAVFPAVGTFYLKVGSRVAYEQMLATMIDLERLCVTRKDGMQRIRMVLEREHTVFNPVIKGVRTKIEKWVPKLSVDYAALNDEDKQLLGAAVGQSFQTEVTEADLEETDDDGATLTDQPPQAA